MEKLYTNTNKLGKAYILTVYYALKPLYLWKSGSLQLSDISLLLGLMALILGNKGRVIFRRETGRLVQYFAFLVLFQISINTIWYIQIQDRAFIKYPLYYVYNLWAVALCLLIGQSEGVENTKRAIAIGSFISMIVNLFGIMINTGLTRSTGFFNNPNQLGYYAVIMLTTYIICKDKFKNYESLVVVVGSIYSVVFSLSKAAIVAYAMLAFVYIIMYQEKRGIKKVIIQIILLVLLLFSLYWLFYSDNSVIVNNRQLSIMRYRILHMMEENDSNLDTGRGYGRIFEVGPHFIWGMGEGGFNRFNSRRGAELHSTFVSLFVCYGLIGLIGYVNMFYKCIRCRGRTIYNLSIMSGLFLYSITHNGIRNTQLWIILSVLFMESIKQEKKYQADISSKLI